MKLNVKTVGIPAAFTAGVAAVLLIAATPSGDTPAPTPEAVQTLNTPAPEVNAEPTEAPVAPTPEPVTTTTPVPDPIVNAPTPDPVVNVPATAAPAPSSDDGGSERVCPAWTEPGWYGEGGMPMSCVWAMWNPGGTLVLKECEHEDQEDCFWDASKHGNRLGDSFINIRGHYFYDGSIPRS